MTYLLDINAFSDWMRKHAKLDARMASLSPAERVVICTIVRGEIRFGLESRRSTSVHLASNLL
jgi:predicted nucleic acid-binding protein